MTNEELLSVAAIVERATNRFHQQAADHEAKMVEHRAAFGARTKADAETIDRLRAERDRLRAEVAALQERLRASIACGDLAQMEVAALKSQTPKHPVKVGEHVAWCGSGFLTGTIKQVAEVRSDRAYRFTDDDVWSFALCEPCDPPATHDTEAGKAAAEAAVKTEPVADDIKVGDVVRPKVWGIGQMTKVNQVLPDGTLLIEHSIKTWKVDEVVKLVRKCVGADEAWTEVRKVTT